MKIAIYFLIIGLLTLNIYSSELVPYSDFGKSSKIKEWNKNNQAGLSEKHSFRIHTERDGTTERVLVSREFFDESGKLIKFESLDYYGNVQVASVHKYNAENMLIEIEETDNFRTLVQKQVFSYDPYDKLVKIEATGFNDAFISKTMFEYIPEKSVAIESSLDLSDEVSSYIIHLYDKSFNRIIKSTNYTPENEIDGLTAYFYDEYGINSREVYKKNIDEPYSIKYHHIHDNNGNLIEVRNISYPDVLMVTVKHDYNKDGLVTKTSMYSAKNELITTIDYEYVFRK